MTSKAELSQGESLPLDRCPHCNIAVPRLNRIGQATTQNNNGTNQRSWEMQACSVCGGVVLTCATKGGKVILDMWPAPATVDETIPERARLFLKQAIDSLHAPSGAIVLAASSVDSMLKAKGYKAGVLNARINEAKAAGLITAEMAEWAHDIRLDANSQRHADEDCPLPNEADAKRVIEFAQALGDFLFVLPARVAHGRAISGGVTTKT